MIMAARMKEKKKPPYNLNARITSAIRRVWRTFPLRSDAIKLAKDPLTPKHLICAGCSFSIHEKLMTVDHINPIVSVNGDNSWDARINRMFYPEGGISGLQCLCEACHKEKTLQERLEKSAYKKSLKDCGKRKNGNIAKAK